MSTDGESILFEEESRSYLKASCGTQTHVTFASCSLRAFLLYSLLWLRDYLNRYTIPGIPHCPLLGVKCSPLENIEKS